MSGELRTSVAATLVVQYGKDEEMATMSDEYVRLVVAFDQLVLALAWHSRRVEETMVLAHVERKRVEHVGRIERVGLGRQAHEALEEQRVALVRVQVEYLWRELVLLERVAKTQRRDQKVACPYCLPKHFAHI